MKDRFKFRARITCIVNRDTEEEKMVSFYINDVAVYRYDDIGFSRDQLLEALSKLDLTEAQKDEIEEDISENSYCEDYEWYSIEFGTKEQCTGLKDKNGKLIYEGDLIKEPANKYPLEIYYNKGAWLTREYRKNGNNEQLLYVLINCYGVEVIGNIHDNKDLLEQKDVAED